jgi:hypothetical protein
MHEAFIIDKLSCRQVLSMTTHFSSLYLLDVERDVREFDSLTNDPAYALLNAKS